MSILELILIAVGLAMDAFAVSLCLGLGTNKLDIKRALSVGLCFGLFQGIMPFMGWIVGIQFQSYITNYDHWIAFVLLAFIGGHMIYEVFHPDDEENSDNFSFFKLVIMGIATSIDALAVGISFAVLKDVNIAISSTLIAVITFAISFVGVILGKKFGDKLSTKAEVFGGLILIFIGSKILIEHLFFS